MKAFRQVGDTIEISGVSGTTVAPGSVYRRTGVSGNFAKAWVGVVVDEIVGTDQDATTIDGRPIQIGDGVLAEAQNGTGKGDMKIEGVFTLRLPTSGMVVNDADPLYMHVADVTNPGTIASGVTNNQDAAFNRFAISGALVGWAVGSNYTGTSTPYNGLNVVDVKLTGLPLHGLAAVAPGA